MKRTSIVLVVVFVALLASFEFFHELHGDHAENAFICIDPATQRSPLSGLLLMHMTSHR